MTKLLLLCLLLTISLQVHACYVHLEWPNHTFTDQFKSYSAQLWQPHNRLFTIGFGVGILLVGIIIGRWSVYDGTYFKDK